MKIEYRNKNVVRSANVNFGDIIDINGKKLMRTDVSEGSYIDLKTGRTVILKNKVLGIKNDSVFVSFDDLNKGDFFAIRGYKNLYCKIDGEKYIMYKPDGEIEINTIFGCVTVIKIPSKNISMIIRDIDVNKAKEEF